MVDEIDIWRLAHSFIKDHGDDAEAEATRRATEWLAKGDMGGHAVYERVVNAIGELRRSAPREGEAAN